MSDEVYAALIGLGGATVGAIIQWIVARATIRSETERLYVQLRDEFRFQQFSAWQSTFQSVISDLLAATDPEINQQPQKQQSIPLVLKAQLMLDPNYAPHVKVNGLINKLALAVNGWHGPQDTREILSAHSALLDAARETLYLPRL